MKIDSEKITVGTEPTLVFIGAKATPKVTFNGAENYNMNVGTKEEPKWETKNTSWYEFQLFGSIAEEFLNEGIVIGDTLTIEGYHYIDKYVNKKGETVYFPKYTIKSFVKHERHNI